MSPTETLSPAQLRRELERKVPESRVVTAGLHTFAIHGWRCHRQNVGGMEREQELADGTKSRRYVAFGEEGLPDITGFTPWGAHVAAEAKRPSGDRRLTPPQADYLDAVRKAGGVAIVFSSAQELQDAIELAEQLYAAERCAPEYSKRRREALEVLVAAVEARFALRPGDRERWALAKAKRRGQRRAKNLRARRG